MVSANIPKLPPLPSDLKVVAPFMQRAEELITKEPVLAYWCTYYAAQLGLDMKTQQAGARDYLFAMITRLEAMKKNLGANDAIDHESAGAAYVENFALKVFAMADNEDRSGEANRSTAKKFLAAANFLELLKIFEKSNNAQVNGEKIRYAQWKAADIAKAIREGRKPTPGAASDPFETDGTPLAGAGSSLPSLSNPSGSKTCPSAAPNSISSNAPVAPWSSGSSQPSAADANPSLPTISQTPSTPLRFSNHLPADLIGPRPGAVSPGSWSTAATPGEDSVNRDFRSAAFASAVNGQTGLARMDDTPSRKARKATVSGELEGHRSDEDVTGNSRASSSTLINAFTDGGLNSTGRELKKVHFSPSVVGGLSSTDGSPPPSPGVGSQANIYSPPGPPDLPPAGPLVSQAGWPAQVRAVPRLVPLPDSETSNSPHESTSGSPPNTSPAMRRPSPPHAAVPPPPHGPQRSRHSPPQPPSRLHPMPTITPSAPLPPSNFHSQASAPIPPQPPILPDRASGQRRSPPWPSAPQPPPIPPHAYTPAALAQAPPPPPPPVELSSSQIAKAQKHCRFAISALEYEDAEQARKELRAALAVLGG